VDKSARGVGDELERRLELLESRSRAFATTWWIAEDYAIDGAVVRPLVNGRPVDPLRGPEAKAKEYSPLSYPEIVGEFAKLAGGQEGGILAFVRRYGLLGYWAAFRLAEEWLGATELGHDPEIRGDPVAWILAHASAVNLVLELAEALSDPARLVAHIQRLTVRDDRGFEQLSYALPRRGLTLASQVSQRPFRNSRDAALHVIVAILDVNLQGVSRGMGIERRDDSRVPELVNLFYPENLLDCIYWHLADAVVGSSICRCENCQRFFIATHGRMRYCPRLMGEEGVSRCMNQAKQRSFRQKNRNGKALRRRGQQRR
jgi:hypothetical protein